MDFIEGLPKSGGKDTILVVDKFIRMGIFLALSHLFTATKVAKIFMEHMYKLHGLPKSIISNKDKTFTSHFWQELFKQLGTS